jgi:hypothetical protein
MTIALVLFGVAILGGLVLAGIRFSGRPYPPLPLALVHGAAAAAGLVALIVAVAGGEAPAAAKAALLVFVAAAAGGFALFSHHLRKLSLPVWLVVVHALVAAAAFLILLSAGL